MDAYDKYDHELCGTEKPHPVVSDGPRLVMVFSSGELQGRGFKVIEIKKHYTASSVTIILYDYVRVNIHSKRNIKSQERQLPMVRAALLIVVHRRKKANSIHHVILPIIHPTQTVHLSFLQHRMNKSQSYSIILK